MFKRCKVVLSPTNQKANIMYVINPFATERGNLLTPSHYGFDKINGEYQHLYILSNEEIKEGDWFMRTHLIGVPIDGVPTKANEFVAKKQSYLGDYIMKIIATTDPSLLVKHNDVYNGLTTPPLCSLPSPSPAFIEKYVSEYNKGNRIYDVMVEYNSEQEEWSDISGAFMLPESLKVNPKDNTITIKRVKFSWIKY
jgi:hypothetical protein